MLDILFGWRLWSKKGRMKSSYSKFLSKFTIYNNKGPFLDLTGGGSSLK
jgi:hypothetical protein